MNIHQTLPHAQFLESIGWIIEKKKIRGKTLFVFVRKLPLFPLSFMKIQRVPLSLVDWKWLDILEKKYHVYETVLELDEMDIPQPDLFNHGFQPTPDFMLNTKTRILDLTKSENQLLKEMKPKCRYNLHLADKHHLKTEIIRLDQVVRDNNVFEAIYSLLKTNAQRINMLLIPKSWIRLQYQAFGETGWIVKVTLNDELLAVSTFYSSRTTGSYNLNGSTAEGRRLMAPTLAVWVGILEAKRRQLEDFDFDGVFDERYPKRQQRFQGFGRFKAGFGGKEVTFPPMYRHRRWPW